MTTITRPSRCAKPLRRPSATRRRGPDNMRFPIAAFLLLLSVPAQAEDGYDLWLRYRPMEAAALAQYRPAATAIVAQGASPTLKAARDELVQGLSGLLDKKVTAGPVIDGAVVMGTPASSALVAGLKLPLTGLGAEGY